MVDMIYFDNAATSFPKSQGVINAVAEAMRECGNQGRGSYQPAIKALEEVYSCREAIGDLVGQAPERIVLTPNTTYALNFAINGLITGGNVLMSCLEHNSVCRPLYALKNSKRIGLYTFDVDIYDDDKTVYNVKKLCRHKVSAVVLTHASNVCGKILPVKAIAKQLHAVGGIVILDSAQTAGYTDISFEKTDADVICLAGHKGLGGPLGTGAMAISGSVAQKILPTIYGGSGIASTEKGMPRVLPERLEAGTVNAPAFAGLKKAILELERGNERKVFEFLTDRLKKMAGVTLYGAPDGDTDGFVPVLLFNIKGFSSDEVANRLASKGICVRSGRHCSPLAHKALGSDGGVRISVGKKNTIEEAKQLLAQLEALTPAR